MQRKPSVFVLLLLRPSACDAVSFNLSISAFGTPVLGEFCEVGVHLLLDDSHPVRLNASKTQVMWLGLRHNLDRVTVSEVQVLTSTVRVVSSARDLGVDSRLTMTDYVASVCGSAYYHLRQIRPTVQSLTPDGSNTLVQSRHSSPGAWTIATRCSTE